MSDEHFDNIVFIDHHWYCWLLCPHAELIVMIVGAIEEISCGVFSVMLIILSCLRDYSLVE